jgi:hypothetical protein
MIAPLTLAIIVCLAGMLGGGAALLAFEIAERWSR